MYLKQGIGHLSKRKQGAFALLLCERMVPVLNSKFARETGFNNSVYRKHFDNVWRNLDQGTSSSDYGEGAKQCLDHAPDTEEFGHPLVSAALKAALSVTETMEFLADDDVNHFVEIAIFARDTAASYTRLALSYDAIMKHPLVRYEL